MKKLLLVCLFLALTVSKVNAATSNLLDNGDFESISDNKPAKWYLQSFNEKNSNITISKEKVHNGIYALKIENIKDNDTRLIQYIKVKPNKYYSLSGWIATNKIEEGKIGANLSVITSSDRSETVNGSKDWTFIEFYFKTNASQKGITVGPRLGSWGSIVFGTAYFDDLSLTEIDELPKIESYKTLEDNSSILYSEVQNRKQKSVSNWYKIIFFSLIIIALFIAMKIIFKKHK